MPGGEDYLRSIGMMPEISSMTVDGRGDTSAWDRRVVGAVGGGGYSRESQSPQQQQQSPYANLNRSLGTQPRMNINTSGVLSANKQIGGGGGNLESSLERQIQQLLQGGSGYSNDQENLMRTRAGDYAAGQQATNEQRMREDAIRRGASTSAGGDADIRSELNRVSAQGAMGQQQATQDVDRMLADLRRQNVSTGLSAGGGLLGQRYGQQLGQQQLAQRERESLRELEMLLASLQGEQGGMNSPGLQFIMGGR
jgi:hypothetical protein